MIEVLPVAVYDVETKTCVMLFCSINKTDRYVFDKMNYGSSRTRYLVSNKGKTNKNPFERMLAFRYANKEQREQLGDKEILILDDAFIRDNIKVDLQMSCVKQSANTRRKSVSSIHKNNTYANSISTSQTNEKKNRRGYRTAKAKA